MTKRLPDSVLTRVKAIASQVGMASAPADVAFVRQQSLLRLIMHNLAYPAVLGSVLYSVVDGVAPAEFNVQHGAYLLMMLSILVFYAVDFLTSFMKSRYSWLSLFSDVTIVGLMYAAFRSVNFFNHSTAPDSAVFSACLAMTFGIFVIVDILHRRAYGTHFSKIIAFEVGLVVTFAVLATVPFKGAEWVIAGTSAVTACVMAWVFGAMYRAKYGGTLAGAENEHS